MEDGTYLRFMQPMVTEASCLKCHGAQGYREGDLRGGISVSVPWAPYGDILRRQTAGAALSHLAVWGLGAAGLLGFRRRLSFAFARLDRTEDELRLALDGKETLLRELHHRTKNSLNMIIAMLDLQAAEHPGNDGVKRLVGETDMRIRSMSLVHQMLYRKDKAGTISLDEYVRELATGLKAGFPSLEGRVELELRLGPMEAAVDLAIPLGLALNELLTNSFKYAFPGEARGMVFLEMDQDASGGLAVKYRDDGVGLPAGFDSRNQPSLGLKLVHGIVEDQLRGSMELSGTDGFRCEFSLPAPKRA